MAQVRRFDVTTLLESMYQDYSVLCLSYFIVYPRRVRIQTAAIDYFKKVMSNMSLAPVVVSYQGDWAPSSQAASLLKSYEVPLGAL